MFKLGRHGKLWWLLTAVLALLMGSCAPGERPLARETSSWAELREVRRGVTIVPPRGPERALYPRERVTDGSRIQVAPGGLAWLRLDTGITLLVRGPAQLRQRPRSVELESGRIFVDSPPGITTEVVTPHAPLAMAAVRASVEVRADRSTEAYVLSGEVRAGPGRAQRGERLLLTGGTPQITPALAWEDWTGGLATTDRPPSPPPFGVGTVGARLPGERGSARFPLVIQDLDVKVTVQGDFAITRVEQSFFNPASDRVEGIYGFRTPPGATLERFGMKEPDGSVRWGWVKEQQAAAQQYSSHVYEGSTEDPAILEWDSPGAYRARLYPIEPGETRRVVVSYTEWLPRSGADAKRRLYVYPMAAEGAESFLPHIEEFSFALDLTAARASSVRTGMAGVRRGNQIIVRAQDFVPRADLSVELYDFGPTGLRSYRSKHKTDLPSVPPAERAKAQIADAKEQDYWLLPIPARELPKPPLGLDLAIVVDASAATEPASLALARATVGALLAHLGPQDRVAINVGAESLRPVRAGLGRLVPVDGKLRGEAMTGLARVEPGGATDLAEMLVAAAGILDPKRAGAVVYVGDGRPTVGELSPVGVLERLRKLQRPTRIYALGIGLNADLGLLSGLTRGGLAERVEDGYAAAQVALRLLEHAERPTWMGAAVDLGTVVERLYPRDPSTWVEDETLLLVGRVSAGEPKRVRLTTPAGQRDLPLVAQKLDDHGDLQRRWGLGRLNQLLSEGAGRAALVDIGMRHRLITPVTSFYVPTTKEASDAQLERPTAQSSNDRGGFFEGVGRFLKQAFDNGDHGRPEMVSSGMSDNKEGGTGARALGAEGSMGSRSKPAGNKRYAVAGPSDSPAPAIPLSPSADDAVSARGNLWGSEIGEGQGGGGIGIAGIGTLGGGADTIGGGKAMAASAGPASQGFGSGHGRLGGTHAVTAPRVRMGATTVSGGLPPEVIQRIVRQNYGRFRLCYEAGLARNPNLEGKVGTRFLIVADGSVGEASNSGSDMPDSSVVACVVAAFRGLSFPMPEGNQVTVVYPIHFSPGGPHPEGNRAADAAAIGGPTGLQVLVRVLPRVPSRCSAAAGLPLGERVTLWRERLANAGRDPLSAVAVYDRALRDCEATSFGDRARLLGLMLGAMGEVAQQVELWRGMKSHLGAAEVLYRGILARVKTAADSRALHAALGLKTVDPGVLRKTVRDAKTPPERVKQLEELRRVFPDDSTLALRLLDALEDATDHRRARELARELRRREDADAVVRTAVGEFYLRQSTQGLDPEAKAGDLAEARRAFGEIVEFAPADPVARRRLGDLLRAHAWHAEARRQYETLAQLSPDDPTVALLLAASAQGEGRLEEAIRWTEKGRDAGSPDVAQGPAVTARIVASTFLAWGRLEAREGKRAAELELLSARAARYLPDAKNGGTRVVLSWVHPDFHPTLWSNAQGSPLPANRGDSTMGVMEATVPLKEGTYVELRVEPDELDSIARLGAEAVLTVVFDELGPQEKVVRLPVRFERGGPGVIRFALRGNEVSRG